MKATSVQKIQGERVSVGGLTAVIPDYAPIAFRVAKPFTKEASCSADRPKDKGLDWKAGGSTHGSEGLKCYHFIQLLKVRFLATKCHEQIRPTGWK
jgi:hypothetical protein